MVTNEDRLLRRTCAFCGKHFFSVRADAKTCSNVCRSKMMRWRKRLGKYEHDCRDNLAGITKYLNYWESRLEAIEVIKDIMADIYRELGSRNIEIKHVNRRKEA